MADINARQRQLIGSTADWAAHDLLIGAGELALERSATGVKIKIGDGVKTFSQLAYFETFSQAQGDVRYVQLANQFTQTAADARYLPLAGGTLTGALNLPAAAPTADAQASTKKYVDDQIATRRTNTQQDARFLQLTGGTLTGALTLPATAPTADAQASTKKYVDDQIATRRTNTQQDARFLQLSGGTLTGALNLPAVTGASLGTVAATKAYVDGLVTGALEYKGGLDVTAAAPTAKKVGDFYVVTTGGTVDGSFAGLGGDTLSGGDMLFWDGTSWDALAARQDIDQLIRRNPTTAAQNTITQTVAGAVPLTIIPAAGSTTNAFTIGTGLNPPFGVAASGNTGIKTRPDDDAALTVSQRKNGAAVVHGVATSLEDDDSPNNSSAYYAAWAGVDADANAGNVFLYEGQNGAGRRFYVSGKGGGYFAQSVGVQVSPIDSIGLYVNTTGTKETGIHSSYNASAAWDGRRNGAAISGRLEGTIAGQTCFNAYLQNAAQATTDTQFFLRCMPNSTGTDAAYIRGDGSAFFASDVIVAQTPHTTGNSGIDLNDAGVIFAQRSGSQSPQVLSILNDFSGAISSNDLNSLLNVKIGSQVTNPDSVYAFAVTQGVTQVSGGTGTSAAWIKGDGSAFFNGHVGVGVPPIPNFTAFLDGNSYTGASTGGLLIRDTDDTTPVDPDAFCGLLRTTFKPTGVMDVSQKTHILCLNDGAATPRGEVFRVKGDGSAFFNGHVGMQRQPAAKVVLDISTDPLVARGVSVTATGTGANPTAAGDSLYAANVNVNITNGDATRCYEVRNGPDVNYWVNGAGDIYAAGHVGIATQPVPNIAQYINETKSLAGDYIGSQARITNSGAGKAVQFRAYGTGTADDIGFYSTQLVTGADYYHFLAFDQAANTQQAWIKGDGSAFFNGHVGIGAQPHADRSLQVVSDVLEGARIARTRDAADTISTTSTDGVLSIAALNATGATTPTNAASQYLINARAGTDQMFTVKGDGSAYFAGNVGIGATVSAGFKTLIRESNVNTVANRSALDVQYNVVGGSHSSYSVIRSYVSNTVTNKDSIFLYKGTRNDGGTVNDVFTVNGAGDIYAMGISATAGNAVTSDRRLKTKFEDTRHDPLEVVRAVKIGHYDRTDIDMPDQYGIEAQSLEGVLDQAVHLLDQFAPEFEKLYMEDKAEKDDEGKKTTVRARNEKPVQDDHKIRALSLAPLISNLYDALKIVLERLDKLEAA